MTPSLPPANLPASVLPRDFSTFVEGYIEAMLFSTNDESDDSGGEPMEKNYSSKDLTPESQARIEATCARFIEHTENLILAAVRCKGYSWNQAGHDLWLTTAGHGVGFMDRNLPEALAADLDQRCEYKEMYIEVGDDRRLHYSGTEHDFRTEEQRVRDEMAVLRKTLADSVPDGPAAGTRVRL